MISPHRNLLTSAFLGFVVATILSLAGEARLQEARTAPATAQEPLKVRSDLVVVETSVADNHGKFAGGLAREQFQVFDDGAPRPLALFVTAEEPAQVCALVETSPAVYLLERQHLEAAYALLGGLAADDKVALATYDQSARVLLTLPTDKAALADALSGLQYILGAGELNFYGAVDGTLKWMAGTPGKKALLLLSTGLDTSPPEHWQELERMVRESDTPIFSVALGGTLREYDATKAGQGKKPRGKPKRKAAANDGVSADAASTTVPATAADTQPSFQRADKALKDLAEISGGRAYFPASPDDFARIYEEVAAQLRHEYLLGFVPPARDGKVHKIEVRVLDAKGNELAGGAAANGWRVYARQSYIAADGR